MEEAGGWIPWPLDVLSGRQPSCFRAIFHELSLSHCLSADNSHCSGSELGGSNGASFSWGHTVHLRFGGQKWGAGGARGKAFQEDEWQSLKKALRPEVIIELPGGLLLGELSEWAQLLGSREPGDDGMNRWLRICIWPKSSTLREPGPHPGLPFFPTLWSWAESCPSSLEGL